MILDKCSFQLKTVHSQPLVFIVVAKGSVHKTHTRHAIWQEAGFSVQVKFGSGGRIWHLSMCPATHLHTMKVKADACQFLTNHSSRLIPRIRERPKLGCRSDKRNHADAGHHTSGRGQMKTFSASHDDPGWLPTSPAVSHGQSSTGQRLIRDWVDLGCKHVWRLQNTGMRSSYGLNLVSLIYTPI